MPNDLPDLRETAGAPIAYWAILVWDPALKEKRVMGIYLEGRDANIDAMAMEGGDTGVTVEPWLVYTEPRFGSAHEPAWETNDDDFDVAIQGDDL